MFAFFNNAGGSTTAASSDPFGGSLKPADPFGGSNSKPVDPFASSKSDPFAKTGNRGSNLGGGLNDIFAKPSAPSSDPFANLGTKVSLFLLNFFILKIFLL